jgi:hypothetical protein
LAHISSSHYNSEDLGYVGYMHSPSPGSMRDDGVAHHRNPGPHGSRGDILTIVLSCPNFLFQISSGSLTETLRAIQWAPVMPVPRMRSLTWLFLKQRLSWVWHLGGGLGSREQKCTVPLRCQYQLLCETDPLSIYGSLPWPNGARKTHSPQSLTSSNSPKKIRESPPTGWASQDP